MSHMYGIPNLSDTVTLAVARATLLSTVQCYCEMAQMHRVLGHLGTSSSLAHHARGGLCLPRPTVVVRALQKNSDELKQQQQQNIGVAKAPDLTEIPEAPSTSGRETQESVKIESKGLPYPILAAVAGLGLAETTYLTVTKLTGGTAACPISGCETVLNSSYAELFGMPLPLFGMLAYGSVLGVSLLALQSKEEDRSLFNMFLGVQGSVMAGASMILVYILLSKFANDPCVWCYGSAALSFTLFGLITTSMPARQLQQAAMPGLGALATAVLALYMGWGGAEPSSAGEDFVLPYSAPIVTEQSSNKAITLAKKLKDAGARMYGAFWCSHCFDQKQAFGKEAMADFPYVECYPDGWKKGVTVIEACDVAGIRAFPTWVINGKLVEGELTLDALEAELASVERVAPEPKPYKSPFVEQ